MLLRLRPLVVANRLQHPPVPLLVPTLVDHLVQDIVQVVHRIYHLPDVGGLNLVDCRLSHGVHLEIATVAVGVAIDAADVVFQMKRMCAPSPPLWRGSPAIAVKEAPPFKEHD